MQDTPDTCGRKSYPERKSCGFKHIRIRVDGAKEKNRVGHSVWNNKKDFRFFTGDLVNNVSCPPSHEIKRHTIEIQGGPEKGCCPEMGLSLNVRPQRTASQIFEKNTLRASSSIMAKEVRSEGTR